MTKDTRLTESAENPLRELCRPDSESHEDSIRIALEAAGIQGTYRTGVQFGGGARVYVPQLDYDRAKEAISGLQSTSVSFNGPENPYIRIFRWVFALSVAVFVLRQMWIMVSR
jgi:hypothetical protein